MTVPTLFLSTASDDLGEWRDALHHTFERVGYKVYTQRHSFTASAGDVLHLLRQHIDRSDFVLHLTGLAYGAEPEQAPFPDAPGFICSYTQFEYYYAHLQGKPVIAFVCTPTFPFRTFVETGVDETDRERRRLLQQAHRERVSSGRFTGTPLDGHRQRPLSESIGDEKTLLMAVGGAIGAISGGMHSAQPLAAAAQDLIARGEATCGVEVSCLDGRAPSVLIGREADLASLSEAWEGAASSGGPKPNVLTVVALGGEGKTSLVARWVADFAARRWRGCQAAFAWSFAGHDPNEGPADSSDLFLKEALSFFGDAELANSSRPAVDKARRLAELVGQRRALLVLDGLELLQYAPSSQQAGRLKDDGILALLRRLAASNQGLCVVTSRYSVTDLRNYWQTTAPEKHLSQLSVDAGRRLLESLGVRAGRRDELERLVRDVKGHALTLNLLGSYLREAHGGDIRKRDLVRLEDADLEEQNGCAFRAMGAYVEWFEGEGEHGQQALSVLLVMGLFDRPASAGCLDALRRAPEIPDLTEYLVRMSDAQRNIVFTRLAKAKLVTVIRDAGGALLSVDAHPLLREYLARRLSERRPAAWRAGHRRVCEYLIASATPKEAPTLTELDPLYQAIGHGCQAGLETSMFEVYRDLIRRGTEHYSLRKLGAMGADLGAVACFFAQPWSQLLPTLDEGQQAYLLSSAAFALRATSRLTEAKEAAPPGLRLEIERKDWDNAAISASNLSELYLTLGEISNALDAAELSVQCAEKSGDEFHRLSKLTTLASAQHHAGRGHEAVLNFLKAEAMQVEAHPKRRWLPALQGFKYCDLILEPAERLAWIMTAAPAQELTPAAVLAARDVCEIISTRSAFTLAWMKAIGAPLAAMAAEYLTAGRVALYASIVGAGEPSFAGAVAHVEAAVEALRAGNQDPELPRGLLTRAWLRMVSGSTTGPNSAQADLDEAWEIAERGPMPLFMADVHLHRARLFHTLTPYPWATDATGYGRTPQTDLAAARVLIERCGYGRRNGELEDAAALVRA